jgi:hypothetical protein
MSYLREVLIVVSNIKTGDTYLARSYPHRDYDGNGLEEYYRVDIYKIFIEGHDGAGKPVKIEWTAPRFMPYWNNPLSPDPRYLTKGWINSGKHYVPRQLVKSYNPDYPIHNMPSGFLGAIPIQGSFLVHAGPQNLTDLGWASAGCVEVVGDFNQFRRNILDLAGSLETDISNGMLDIVKARKLYIQVDLAIPPDFRRMVVGERAPP